jgi:invasion protein IalB
MAKSRNSKPGCLQFEGAFMNPTAALLWSIALYLMLGGAASAADPRAARLNYSSWMKSCIGSSCFVAIEARGQCLPSGGSLAITLEDGKPVSVSSNFRTKSGVHNPTSLRIDAGDPIPLPDQTCFPSGLCINRLAIDGDLIARLKRAQTITIDATDMTGQRLSVSFSLAGFAEAFEGPGIEPKVRTETISSEAMKEMMQRAEAEKRECKE